MIKLINSSCKICSNKLEFNKCNLTNYSYYLCRNNGCDGYLYSWYGCHSSEIIWVYDYRITNFQSKCTIQKMNSKYNCTLENFTYVHGKYNIEEILILL